MEPFKVYPVYPVALKRGEGHQVFDEKGQAYLDLYGGHGVISIGHSHPHFVQRLSEQLSNLTFYSNSVEIPMQKEMSGLLGQVSGCRDYALFLCNSGAEANENALKLASFHTGRKKVIAFEGAFHGRTSAAVAVTDNKKINAPLNAQHEVVFLPLNDEEALEAQLKQEDVAAVIVEGIQGVGGLDEGNGSFFKALESLCKRYGTVLILDEIQAGYGRTGHFFSFQAHGIQPDLITVAKGMGNGFPIAGVLIGDQFEASFGLLGTTFGGNHLACAAGLAVLEVIKAEKLIDGVAGLSAHFLKAVQELKGLKRVKGRGLMMGLEFDFPVAEVRKQLVLEKNIFTGGSANPNLIRILPPLNIDKPALDQFVASLSELLSRKTAMNTF